MPITTTIVDSSRPTNRSRVAPSGPERSAASRAARLRKACVISHATISATRSEAPALIHASTSMPVSASFMAAHTKPVAVLFDALGTLLTFEPPAPHLRAALRERTGVDIGEQGAVDAIRAEIAYYRAHLHEGRDPESLLDLRIRCAQAMNLPFPTPVVLDALLASLRFYAYEDSARVLRALRAAGIRTAVISNWDWSLHERLHETGLAELVDGALASAEVGSAKPDGAIFAAALELVGARPGEAWHVGDTPEADIEGARAAGIRPVLIARDGADGADVHSLDELIPLALP
jgi:putative hydrolase of the HAD superfamily